MKFTVGLLKEIYPKAEFSSYYDDKNNLEFSFLNIAVPVGEKAKEIDYSETLYFPVYAKNVEKDGWYNSDFDRRIYLNKVFKKNPNWHFVVDGECKIVSEKYIKVDNSFEFIKAIYSYILSESKAKVVAVTGSVGKTTTVSMLEHVISQHKKVLRLFSKRITPLVLWSLIINFLEKDTEVIVSEVSLYRKFHVEWLTDNLKPEIAIILNIEKNHLGVDFKTRDEIFEAKKKIFKYAKTKILNLDNDLMKNSEIQADYFSLNSKNVFAYYDLDSDIFFVNSKAIILNNIFLKTKLTINQILVSLIVLEKLGLEITPNILDNFQPKENRILLKERFGRMVLFDGDTSSPSRLYKLVDSFYKNKILIIEELNFGIEPIEPMVDEFYEIFNLVDKVYVSKECNIPIELKEVFKNKKIKFVNLNNDFVKRLPKNAFIFWHYGSFYKKKIFY